VWTETSLTEGYIYIYFYNGTTATWSFVTGGIARGTLTYSWTVPNVTASNCKVRIWNHNPSLGTWIAYGDSAPFAVTMTP
jgi:hypothetical protein